MRLGQNPAKSVEGVNNPADIAIVLLTYVPFISGYYQDSPEVIRTAITSILENTSELFDLMVFDNGSCKEVQDYLVELKDQKKIQRLVLSDINIGKVNAWNFILRGTTSEFVVFADSDVYFHPGWLEAHLDIFNTYPEVGMLTGRPLRNPLQFSTHTMDWAENNAEVEISKGLLQQWDVYKVHADSVGLEEDEARQKYKQGEDVQLVYKNVKALVGAGHFQFMTSRKVLDSVLPLKSHRPLGDDRQFDILINESGFLRLTVPEMVVEHMGNRVPERLKAETSSKSEGRKPSGFSAIFELTLVKKVLMRVYNTIFNIYFDTER